MMKKITLSVQEHKYQFFLELIQDLDFVQISHLYDTKEEILSTVEQGFKELEQYNQGNLTTTPAEDFLNEL